MALSTSSPRRFPCTYAECLQSFDTYEERSLHKDIEHDYCLRCDIDFANFEAFLKHKIESDEHIVCPFCGVQFESHDGRDAHIRRAHPIDHQIQCPWKNCDRMFKTANTYINHIEKDQCVSGLNKHTLMVQRDVKILEAQTTHRLISEGPHHPENAIDPATQDTERGGITWPGERRQSLVHQPRITDTLSWKHWPSLTPATDPENHSVTPDKGRDNKIAYDIKRDYANDRVSGAHQTFIATQDAAEDSNPDCRKLVSHTPSHLGSQILKLYRTYRPHFDPNRYLNSYSGNFECCQQEFQTPEKLAEHLISHRSEKFMCPVCKKVMKTVTALVSHAEASEKCNFSRRQNGPELMERVTGGFVKSDSFFDDGHTTIKYHAATRF